MPKRLNIQPGDKFARLTIIEEGEKRSSKRTFKCRCDCGNETIVMVQNLTSGRSQSCGCLAKEINTTHGLSRTPVFNTWVNMIARCQNPNREDYSYYGGRGITVCEEWQDPSEFAAWAKQNGFIPGLTLERKEVDGNYEPSNCSWVDRSHQAANRSKRSGSNNPYIGVQKHGDRWSATICSKYEKTHIGMFDTSEEARDARNKYITQNNLPHMQS